MPDSILPDPILPDPVPSAPVFPLEALGAAAALAAVVLILFGWPWRGRGVARITVGWTLGVGLGFYAGCWLLQRRPHWPPSEDQDRFLILLMPAVFGVELLAVFPRISRRLIWLLRLAMVAGTARLLLHGSIYLTDSLGPDRWSPAQAILILGGLAVALAAEWTLLELLARRAPGRSLPAALALTCAGAGVTVMLSGYFTGGQLALPLAASLAGCTTASLLLNQPPRSDGWLGPGIVGLFGVLVVGRFFSNLSTIHALILFFAPLLSWLPELPYLCRIRPAVRDLIRLTFIAIPVSVAALRAWKS
jgi:hypothetical protein